MGEVEVADEDSTQISFMLLGPLEVHDSNGDRCSLGGTKAERLLAILLLEANHVVPTRRLIEGIWGEEPPDSAVHQIRKAVGELRKRIPHGGGILVTDGSGYRARVQQAQVDVLRFRALTEESRRFQAAGCNGDAIRSLGRALALWRGEILSGAGGRVIEAAAEVLREEYVNAIERFYSLRLERGEGRTVLPELRKAVDGNPYQERLRGLLMLALYQCGRQAEALSEFESVRELLAGEMGLDPGPELCGLHEAILRADPELMPAPASDAQDGIAVRGTPLALAGLPYDLEDFAGREREITELLALGRMPAGRGPRIISVDGMGGVGKTSLIIRAGHILAPEYPDGQIYLDLGGFTPGRRPETPESALDVLLRAVGFPGDGIPDDLGGRVLAWRSVMARRRLLLILDNAADGDQVRPLIPAAPECLVLITSRMRLVELDGVCPLTLEPLDEADGTAMVKAIAGETIARDAPEDVAALVRACGGLPLALRLALARLKHRRCWDMEHLVERLQAPGALDEWGSGARSIRASLSVSYESLSPEEKKAFRLFALCPGADFGAGVAGALLERDCRSAGRVLENLLNAHVIQQFERDRYSFHDLVRSFAGTLRISAGEQRAAITRVIEYWSQVSEAAGNILFPGRTDYFGSPGSGEEPGLSAGAAIARLRGPNDAALWFERERDNMLSALRACGHSGPSREAAMLARNLNSYLSVHDHYTDAFEAGELLVRSAHRVGDKAVLRMALLNHSLNFWALGQYSEGLSMASEAREIAASAEDSRGEAVCLSRIGMFRIAMGDPVGAADPLTRALEIQDQQSGGGRELAVTLTSLAEVSNMRCRHEEAAESAMKALRIQRRLADLNGQIAALHQLAEAAAGQADWERARHWIESATGFCGRFGSPSLGRLMAARAALVWQELGEEAEADAWIAEATREHGQVAAGRRAAIDTAVGAAYLSKRRHADSRRHYLMALAAAGQDDHARAQALSGLSAVSRRLGQSEMARRYADDAGRLFTAIGITPCCGPG